MSGPLECGGLLITPTDLLQLSECLQIKGGRERGSGRIEATLPGDAHTLLIMRAISGVIGVGGDTMGTLLQHFLWATLPGFLLYLVLVISSCLFSNWLLVSFSLGGWVVGCWQCCGITYHFAYFLVY